MKIIMMMVIIENQNKIKEEDKLYKPEKKLY